MKRTLLFPVFILALIVISSCGGNPEAKLIGTWKVSDVQTNFDENQETPEMHAQIVEMQKQTYFRFVNDSTMVIISNNNTHEAKWVFIEEDQSIAYFFAGMETDPNILGILKDELIVNESKTPLGMITTYYAKE
jgi:hypothetical protein